MRGAEFRILLWQAPGCSRPPSVRRSLPGVLEVGVGTAEPSPFGSLPSFPGTVACVPQRLCGLRKYPKAGGALALSCEWAWSL